MKTALPPLIPVCSWRVFKTLNMSLFPSFVKWPFCQACKMLPNLNLCVAKSLSHRTFRSRQTDVYHGCGLIGSSSISGCRSECLQMVTYSRRLLQVVVPSSSMDGYLWQNTDRTIPSPSQAQRGSDGPETQGRRITIHTTQSPPRRPSIPKKITQPSTKMRQKGQKRRKKDIAQKQAVSERTGRLRSWFTDKGNRRREIHLRTVSRAFARLYP